MLVLACIVVAIQTGDMMTVKCPNRPQMTVRVSAIDAPERNQTWGEKSRSALVDLCLKQLARVTPVTSDKLRRTIADVECRGRDVAQYQIRSGNAWVYDRHAREYGNLYPIEYEARKARSGLWAEKTPVAPWDWRYRQARREQPSHQTLTAVGTARQP